MEQMAMSKIEAAQRLLTCAVECGFGTGASMAMVIGAKALCRAAALFPAGWPERARGGTESTSRQSGAGPDAQPVSGTFRARGPLLRFRHSSPLSSARQRPSPRAGRPACAF